MVYDCSRLHIDRDSKEIGESSEGKGRGLFPIRKMIRIEECDNQSPPVVLGCSQVVLLVLVVVYGADGEVIRGGHIG